MGSVWILFSRAIRHCRRHALPLGAGVALLVFDVVSFDGSNALLLLGGSAAICYGVYEIVDEFRKDRRLLLRLYSARRTTSMTDLPRYEPPYDGWTVIRGEQGEAITSTELNRRLWEGRTIEVEQVSHRWKPREDVEELRQLAMLRLDCDETKIRLASDLVDDSQKVRIQRTYYSAFLVTNHTALMEYRRRGENRPVLDYPDTFLIEGRIPTLGRGKLSNHFGGNILGVEPGRIIIIRQSSRNTLSQGLLAPSGSGSSDWSDTQHRDDLAQIVKAGMVRELTEELGLRKSSVPDLSDVRITGYVRMTHLGGKPDFYGVCRLPQIEERVRASEERYTDDFTSIDFGPEPSLASILDSISTFKRRHAVELSLPLLISLELFETWVDADPTAARWLNLEAGQERRGRLRAEGT